MQVVSVVMVAVQEVAASSQQVGREQVEVETWVAVAVERTAVLVVVVQPVSVGHAARR